MSKQVSIVGAPTDIGAGSRGASMGPEALRVANIVPVLQGHGLEVIDRGNLAGPANPWLPPTDGYRHLREVVAWNKAVHEAVHDELALGRLPVLLGGQVPAINPKWIRQIGIRSVDAGEKRFVHEMDLEVFDMRYIDEMGMRHAMELALATLDTNTHLHVSFDVDFLDPDVAPGVGT